MVWIARQLLAVATVSFGPEAEVLQCAVVRRIDAASLV
jgi:hypothetical protein